MANTIHKNGVIILNCANWVMELFYNNLLAIVQKEDLSSNKIICEFLEQLDQDMQGRGFVGVDITDYFNHAPNKLPLKLFHDLTQKTIDRIKKLDLGEFQAGVFKRLDDFKDKILD